jgi:pimeloyl-ACP methyl ester carboxylesterase
MVKARGRVAVWDSGGPGTPVLLLHGFPDHPVGMAELAASLTSAGHRVICPALPGYRPSEPVAGGDYRLSSIAGDLVAVLDELGVDRAAVIGHDWGASLAYRLGALHPDRLTTVVALAAPHDAGFARRRVSFSELSHSAYALFLAFVADAPRAACDRRWLTALAQLASPSLHREDWSAILDQIADEATLGEVCRYYRCDLEDPASPAPVLVPATVIHGTDDGALGPLLFDELEGWFPGGHERHRLEGVGHWPHVERPGETLELIRAAIQDRA